MSDHIEYCAGYKYQLVKHYSDTNGKAFYTGILGFNIQTEYIILSPDGYLDIKCGYAWDGPSGPTIDDNTNLRGSLIHDVGYQLLRLGLLPIEYKKVFDELFYWILIEDGMLGIRATYYYEGVAHFGYASAKLGANPYPVLIAP